MTVYNLGSINIDHVYRVVDLPKPGETLSAIGYSRMLGGKGANQSVAVARAGRRVVHIGMVGEDPGPKDELAEFGVDVAHVGTVEGATGHANICVDHKGENQIVIWSGANQKQSLARLKVALSNAGRGDYILLQNETDLTKEAAEFAQSRDVYVIYSAAPFDPKSVQDMLPRIDLLVMNAGEAAQMSETLGAFDDQSLPDVLITRGAEGATWQGAQVFEQPAFATKPVDTTGAGDCFIGYVTAGLDEGLSIAEALRLGAAASAIQVTRPGTAPAIPARAEVDALIANS